MQCWHLKEQSLNKAAEFQIEATRCRSDQGAGSVRSTVLFVQIPHPEILSKDMVNISGSIGSLGSCLKIVHVVKAIPAIEELIAALWCRV